MRCALTGRHSLAELEKAGMKIVEDATKPSRFNWLAWLLNRN
jgi:hypothetical protein